MKQKSVKDIEKEISAHLKERGWDQLRPSDIAKSIMIEGAELLELFQWENFPLEEVKKNKKKVAEVKKELADVFIYALEMSVLLGLNTEQIIADKLKHVQKKYPAELMKKGAKTGAGSGDAAYWRIKKAYRKERI